MCYNDDMFYWLTEKQLGFVWRILKLLRLEVWLLPWAIVLFCAALLSYEGSLAGLPGYEIAARFVLDVFAPIFLLQFKMLVVVYAIHALWLLIGRDQIEILACYLSVSIHSNISQLIRLWSSLWSQMSALVHLFASTLILWRIQLARMVTPQTGHVAGLSPQLE